MREIVVLQLNVLGKTFSTGRTTRELHDFLKNEGYKSYIACPLKMDCDDVFSFSNRFSIHLDKFFSILTGKEGNHSTFQTYKLIKFIEKINPNIIHLRVLHSNCLNFTLLFRYLSKKKLAVVITMHDFWYITGHCCYFSQIKCNKWQYGCEKCPSLYFGKFRPLFNRTNNMWKTKRKYLNSIDNLAIIGVSDWATKQIKKSFCSDNIYIDRIYNWIDLNTFFPRNNDFKSKLGLYNKKIILAVSTTWKKNDRKGLETYIELAKEVSEEFVIILIGKLLWDDVIPKNIISINRTNDLNELANYYSMADVYLNLSREETFGKVSAEAIACGTPLIAIDSTANKEIIPPGGGILLEDDKVENIINAIEFITKENKEKYINICRQYALNNFNKDKNMRDYLNLYIKMLDQKKFLK